MKQAKLLFQLSWRNIWRHRRRNGMLFVAILVAVSAIVLANALIRGWQDDIIEAVVGNLGPQHPKLPAEMLALGTLHRPLDERSKLSCVGESGGLGRHRPRCRGDRADRSRVLGIVGLEG